MIREQEFLHLVRLDQATLTVWMEEAWLAPNERDGERVFEEIDARARPADFGFATKHGRE